MLIFTTVIWKDSFGFEMSLVTLNLNARLTLLLQNMLKIILEQFEIEKKRNEKSGKKMKKKLKISIFFNILLKKPHYIGD